MRNVDASSGAGIVESVGSSAGELDPPTLSNLVYCDLLPLTEHACFVLLCYIFPQILFCSPVFPSRPTETLVGYGCYTHPPASLNPLLGSTAAFPGLIFLRFPSPSPVFPSKHRPSQSWCFVWQCCRNIYFSRVVSYQFFCGVGGWSCLFIFGGSAPFWATSAPLFLFRRVSREGGRHNRRRASSRADPSSAWHERAQWRCNLYNCTNES